MNLRQHLLSLSQTYATARGVSLARVSMILFNDGKVLARLLNGKDITTGRFEAAIRWFSVNWPEGVAWPEGIARPTRSFAAAASAGEEAA